MIEHPINGSTGTLPVDTAALPAAAYAQDTVLNVGYNFQQNLGQLPGGGSPPPR
jgi:hypothetical protein